MNAIAAHKEDLEELFDDLSAYRLVPGITFVTLLNAYITRVDTDTELTYGPNIDSNLRALLRAAQNFQTARRVLPENSHCGTPTSAGSLPATTAQRTLRASSPLPGQRTLIDVKDQAKRENGVEKNNSDSRSLSPNRSAPDTCRGKPKYLFHGRVK
jgi:hypothetical protein